MCENSVIIRLYLIQGSPIVFIHKKIITYGKVLLSSFPYPILVTFSKYTNVTLYSAAIRVMHQTKKVLLAIEWRHRMHRPGTCAILVFGHWPQGTFSWGDCTTIVSRPTSRPLALTNRTKSKGRESSTYTRHLHRRNVISTGPCALISNDVMKEACCFQWLKL